MNVLDRPWDTCRVCSRHLAGKECPSRHPVPAWQQKILARRSHAGR